MTIKRIAGGAGRAALALGAWTLAMAAMPLVGPEGRRVAVVGDPHHAVRAVAEAGGVVVSVGRRAVVARSDRPGFVRALYAAGAPLVVEARVAAGCLGEAEAKAGA